jgi:hypothetical protein
VDFFAVSDPRNAYTRSDHGERNTRQDCDQHANASFEAIIHHSSLLSGFRDSAWLEPNEAPYPATHPHHAALNRSALAIFPTAQRHHAEAAPRWAGLPGGRVCHCAARQTRRQRLRWHVDLITPKRERSPRRLFRACVLYFPDKRNTNLAAAERNVKVAIIGDRMCGDANMVNDSSDGSRHPISLCLEQGVPQLEFGAEDKAGQENQDECS